LAVAVGTTVALALTTVTSIVVSNIRITAALAQADHNLQNALKVVDELLTRVSEDDLLKESGFDPLRRDLLAKAQAHYQSFLNENANNPRIRRELANAHYRVAVIERELDHQQEAAKSLETAEKLQRAMYLEQPRDPEVRRALSDTLTVAGAWQTRAGNWEQAIAAFQEAVQVRDALADEFSEDREFQRLRASVHMNLGVAYKAQGKLGDAAREEEFARELRTGLENKSPPDNKLLQDTGIGAYNLALLYLERSDKAEDAAAKDADYVKAAQSLDEAISAFEQLVELERRHPLYRYRLLIFYRLRASLSQQPDAYYAKAEPVASRLDAENPETPKYRFEHAALLLDYSDFLAKSEDRPQALERLQQIDRLLTPLAEEHFEASEHLAKAHQLWADLLPDPADADERRTHLQQAIKYFRLADKQTGDETWRNEIARLEGMLATAP
jgi:tetratricopeptide (TPR) repeat protein